MKSQYDYWNKNILAWDKSVYDKQTNGLSFVEKIATYFRKSTAERQDSSYSELKEFAKNKNILEIGCGAGRFSEILFNNGSNFFIGIDISSEAINACKEKFKKLSFDKDKFKFELKSIENINFDEINFDLIVGLGALQYIDDDFLDQFFNKISKKKFFFDLHEDRLTFLNFLHNCYRFIKVTIYKDYPRYNLISKSMLSELSKKYNFDIYFKEIKGLTYISNIDNKNGWKKI